MFFNMVGCFPSSPEDYLFEVFIFVTTSLYFLIPFILFSQPTTPVPSVNPQFRVFPVSEFTSVFYNHL